MNIRTLFAIVAGGSVLPAIYSLQAQELDDRNRFYVGPRLHFNVSAKLTNLNYPGNAPGVFDDGFVLPDISGSSVDTWNWGYSAANQVTGPAGAQQIQLHNVGSPRDGRTDRMDQTAQYGFEAGYGRELMRFGNKDNPVRIGVEGSFSASSLDVDMRNTVSGLMPRTTTVASLPAGVVVPPAPYSGAFEGPLPPNPPMPLINIPTAPPTTSMETVSSIQRAEITGSYWGFRLGPYIEAPLTGRFSLEFGAGLAAVHVDADFSYEEGFTTTGTGTAPVTRKDKESRSEWLMGFYANARLQYWLNDAVALYLGAEFQSLEDFNVNALNKNATVNFDETVGVSLGILYSF